MNKNLFILMVMVTLSQSADWDKVNSFSRYQYGAKGNGNIWNNKRTSTNAVDCTGLIYQAYKRNGMNVMNVKTMSISKLFIKIPINNIRRGDIILWAMDDNEFVPCHATLYMGNNRHRTAESETIGVVNADCFIKKRHRIKGKANRYSKKRVYKIIRWNK
jgi:cell wall-associated NlpC family hydrolase